MLGKPLFCNFNTWYKEPIFSVTWVSLWKTFRSTLQPTQTAFTFTQSIMERSEQCVKDFQHILQLALVFLYLHYKTKALFLFIKVECEFWNHHTSKMGDFSLNPLMFLHKTVKFFTENYQLTFSIKFINNTFDKFNNI